MGEAPRWTPAYVGLGSNLDDPARQVAAALDGLDRLAATRLVLASRPYRSRPVGFAAQPDFVNAVAGLLTRLDAPALHAELHALEARLGKQAPPVRFGPRRIDLDLLVFDSASCDSATLVLPHPRLHERAFVLYPLAEIAPELWIPGHGRVAALRDAVPAEGVGPL
jgi:2-amino-4-hydroxy-6-hydroxymethyldihydropteridine diphosphokinase